MRATRASAGDRACYACWRARSCVLRARSTCVLRLLRVLARAIAGAERAGARDRVATRAQSCVLRVLGRAIVCATRATSARGSTSSVLEAAAGDANGAAATKCGEPASRPMPASGKLADCAHGGCWPSLSGWGKRTCPGSSFEQLFVCVPPFTTSSCTSPLHCLSLWSEAAISKRPALMRSGMSCCAKCAAN